MFNYSVIDPLKVDYVEILPVDQLPEGERIFIEVSGRSIVIFNLAGQYFAIEDVCSHDQGPVGDGDIAGYEITCPRHGAHFDIRSGKATGLPAVVDIPSYPVRVTDGMIEIGIPK